MILHNILQFLRMVGLKASKCVVITLGRHGDPPPVCAKRIFWSKHVSFPRFFAMLPEGGPREGGKRGIGKPIPLEEF